MEDQRRSGATRRPHGAIASTGARRGVLPGQSSASEEAEEAVAVDAKSDQRPRGVDLIDHVDAAPARPFARPRGSLPPRRRHHNHCAHPTGESGDAGSHPLVASGLV